MPERLECEVLQKARYINTLTFTFYLYRPVCQQSRSQGLLLRWTRRSSPAVAVTIASTHFAYPQRDGKAELAWVVG